MTHQEIDSKIAALLEGAAHLRRNWEASPRVMHIPFMGNRDSFYLLISIHVLPKLAVREFLAQETFSVARVAIESGLLKDERAVDVAAYIPGPKGSQRVNRFTVNDTAFDRFRTLEFSELMSNDQHEGIKWSWPLH
jgi:hypothetical protein